MAGWFGKRDKPTLTHDTFGRLELEGDFWYGEWNFPITSTTLLVAIKHVGGRPADDADTAVQELSRRYQELTTAIASELRELFLPWYGEFWKDSAPLPEGAEILERFELEGIILDSTGVIELEYALREGWDDATFRIGLDDWVPKGLGVDD